MISLLMILAHGASPPPPPLDHLLLAAPTGVQEEEAEEAPPAWTGSVTVGGMLSTGNSEQRSGNAAADAELRRTKDRISLGLTWLYDENKNNPADVWTLTDRKTAGKAQYDYFLSDKTYLLGQVGAESDFQAALDLRATAGVGVGRQIREDETFKLSGEIGASFVTEEFKTVPEDDYLSGRAAYGFEWQMSKAWVLAQDGVFLPSFDDADDMLAKLDTRVKASFTESMFGQVQWLFDWDNTPAPGTEREDHRLLLSVGWKF